MSKISDLGWTRLDFIWNGPGINYDSVLRDYGRETVAQIVRNMPNMLKRKSDYYLDEAAQDYGYESTCELVEEMLYYVPKAERVRRLNEMETQYYLEMAREEAAL